MKCRRFIHLSRRLNVLSTILLFVNIQCYLVNEWKKKKKKDGFFLSLVPLRKRRRKRRKEEEEEEAEERERKVYFHTSSF